MMWLVFFFQAEDGIRDLVRSRGLGDVYKRQEPGNSDRPDRLAQFLVIDHLGLPDAFDDITLAPQLSLIHI